jgi:hypothetical protein
MGMGDGGIYYAFYDTFVVEEVIGFDFFEGIAD